MEGNGMIYQLIGQAIGKIGAIGKDKTNAQQGFKYRGIDQVYNALNPVMAELGIFFCPEVIDQKREERVTKNGAVLTYTLLTIRFTAYAPDGSNVSMTVVGEGMDSGDKSSNKAMSVAMKYAMFQLFCIPTEEMKDPDADVYTDILPKGQQAAQSAPTLPQNPPAQVTVTKGTMVPLAPQNAANPAPQPAQQEQETAGVFLKRRIMEMTAAYRNYGFNFAETRKALIDGGLVPDVPSATMTMEQAQELMRQVEGFYEDRKAKAAS